LFFFTSSFVNVDGPAAAGEVIQDGKCWMLLPFQRRCKLEPPALQSSRLDSAKNLPLTTFHLLFAMNDIWEYSTHL
jgi:hypothetical protein